MLDFDKFLLDAKGNHIGYYSGLTFANFIGLTMQIPGKIIIATNKIDTEEKDVVIVKPRVTVNNSNYKILPLFDILEEFKTYCDYDFAKSLKFIVDYIKTAKIDYKKQYEELVVFSEPTKRKWNVIVYVLNKPEVVNRLRYFYTQENLENKTIEEFIEEVKSDLEIETDKELVEEYKEDLFEFEQELFVRKQLKEIFEKFGV